MLRRAGTELSISGRAYLLQRAVAAAQVLERRLERLVLPPQRRVLLLRHGKAPPHGNAPPQSKLS